MATTQDILLTYKTDTGEVTKSLDEIVSGLEGVDNKIEETAQSTKKVEAGLKATGKAGSIGFNAIGGAIKATGIGLLVGLVAKLIEKFTENKKVAEALEVVFAGIGAVINQLFEVVEPLGEAIMNAFKNPMETIKNLGKIIKENIINRFEGMLEFLPAIGKAISLVFKGEFAEAGKVAADAAGKMVLGVENVTDKIAAAGEAIGEFATDFVDSTKTAISSSNDLVKAQQRLRDQQRDLNVEYAQARAEIEQLKQKRDDERLSIEERVEAAQRASDLDQEFADKREAIANREVALVQREIEQQGETVERLDRLAEARIAAAEAAESSAAVQTELMTSIIGLQNEQIAKQEELNALSEEQINDVISRQDQIDEIVEAGQNRDIQKVKDKYLALQEEARLNGQILVGVEEAQRIELEAINSKYDDIDKARREEIKQAILDTAKSSLSALADLNEAFGGESIERQNKIDDLLLQASETKDQSEKESLEKKAKALGKIQDKEGKKQFERGKALSIAQALISTYESATAAFSSLAGIPVVGVGLGIAAASAAVVAGLANVKKIKSQTYKSQGTGGGSSYSSSGSGGSGQQAPTSPQLDLSFLGGGAGQDGFRTYVIASEVSNSQQANQKINDQAALVG